MKKIKFSNNLKKPIKKKQKLHIEKLEDVKMSKAGSCAFSFCGCISFALGYLACNSCNGNHSCDDDECCCNHGCFCIDDFLYVNCCHNDC